MKGVCVVASDYLGVPNKDCEVSFDNPVSEACRGDYYRQKEPDSDHPHTLPKVCGNCMHWTVAEDKKAD